MVAYLIGDGSLYYQQTSFPTEYGINVSVIPSAATANASTENSIWISTAAASVVSITTEPTVPNNPALGIGSMIIGTTFTVT